jgi:site-specific recombinase XerD
MNDLTLFPLEEMADVLLPTTLDGTQGIYRAKCQPLIKANTDIEAINCWLTEYSQSKDTQRNYRKDAERLLLWSINEKQKPLSSLNAEDLLTYSKFLDNPPSHWCGKKLARNGKRWSTNWRPFVGSLSANSKTVAFANLTSLFNYLFETNYLAQNPVLAVRRQVRKNKSRVEQEQHIAERIIDFEEWEAIQEVMNAMSENTDEEAWEKVRVRFLIALFYFGALRNNELATHTMAAFKKVRDWQAGKDRWWLYIVRKGNKLKKIPVNQALLETLITYRQFLKLPDLPEQHEDEPLIKSLETQRAISTRRINQIIKEITFKAAEKFLPEQIEKVQRLRKFSAHWSRHLSLSMQSVCNISKINIKENGGHENEQTTDIYLHAFDNQRHEEMEKLVWRPHTISNELVAPEITEG